MFNYFSKKSKYLRRRHSFQNKWWLKKGKSNSKKNSTKGLFCELTVYVLQINLENLTTKMGIGYQKVLRIFVRQKFTQRNERRMRRIHGQLRRLVYCICFRSHGWHELHSQPESILSSYFRRIWLNWMAFDIFPRLRLHLRM